MVQKFRSFRELSREIGKYPTRIVLEFLPVGSDAVQVVTAEEWLENVDAAKIKLLTIGVSRLALILDKTPELLYDTVAALELGITLAILDPHDPIEKLKEQLLTFGPEKIILQEEDYEEDELKELNSTLQPWHVLTSLEREGDAVFFTSGTSGPSKGVVLSSMSLLASAYCGQCKLACSEEDVILSLLPLSHVFGFICTFLWPLCYGSAIALGRGARYFSLDPKVFHPTILPLIPAQIPFLMKTDAFNEECKTVLVGAGNLGKAAMTMLKRKGIRLALGYGLTETASGVAISVNSLAPYELEPCPGNRFRLDEGGRLLIRSDSIMKGYLVGRKLIPVELDQDGYFRTSDLAEIDGKGNIRILGRSDDVLVLPNGTKADAAKIELDLSSYFPSLDFAVGLKDGVLTFFYHSEEDMDAEIGPKLSKYKEAQPIYARIIGVEKEERKLPRTKTMKIRRYLLK